MSDKKKNEKTTDDPRLYTILQQAGVLEALNQKLDPMEQKILDHRTRGFAAALGSTLEIIEKMPPREKEALLKELLKVHGANPNA
jgi:hypothetical protein